MLVARSNWSLLKSC